MGDAKRACEYCGVLMVDPDDDHDHFAACDVAAPTADLAWLREQAIGGGSVRCIPLQEFISIINELTAWRAGKRRVFWRTKEPSQTDPRGFGAVDWCGRDAHRSARAWAFQQPQYEITLRRVTVGPAKKKGKAK